MKGITFVPTKELSKEAKEKLEKLEVKRQSRLNKIVEDYDKNNLQLTGLSFPISYISILS